MKANPNIKQHMMQTIEPVSKILNNDWYVLILSPPPIFPSFFPYPNKNVNKSFI
jgi:hypothetical protein